MSRELPVGTNMTCVCPECFEIFQSNQAIFLGGKCPRCGAVVTDRDIVFAFSEEQSYEIAKLIQKEKKEEAGVD